MRLAGKTALVTGGASGFGAGMARAFCAEGARVMLADVDGPAVEAMAGVLGAEFVVADVSDDASVAHMAAATLGALGPLDILVNNAGVTHLPSPLEDVSLDDFDRVFRVNARSVYLTARHLVPGMKDRGAGVILNIASTAALSPRPSLSWYNASKGWMVTATKSMAVELASAGVRVNALCPVAGETPLLKSFLGEDTPQMRAKFLATIPLGRFSTPQDLGHAAVFLCSDEAAMLTGVALEVDGGRCV
jgi:3-oxoacyl-[acyl-carrier protein] reductase